MTWGELRQKMDELKVRDETDIVLRTYEGEYLDLEEEDIGWAKNERRYIIFIG